MPTTPPPEIFKAWDVRGLHARPLCGDVAEAGGRRERDGVMALIRS